MTPRRLPAWAGAALAAALLALLLPAPSRAHWKLRPLPPAEEYGNLLMDRGSTRNGEKAAVFSHWIHRRKYTCRLCHMELDFAMKTDGTGVTEKENRAGKYCGACHDGKTAFGHDPAHCATCHAGDRAAGRDRFRETWDYPAARFGNRVDWGKTWDEGRIAPKDFLAFPRPKGIAYEKTLGMEAEWNHVPPAIFPHGAHTRWLECNNCHPDLFNTGKKKTRRFSMEAAVGGAFCGVCHGTVAFPLDDCRRCHPAMQAD